MALEPAAIVRRLEDEFTHHIEAGHTHRGDATVLVRPAKWLEVAQFCKESRDLDMNYFRDLTVVDYIEEHPRFEVVCHLYSLPLRHAVRLKARVPEDAPEIESMMTIYPAANWFEREAWDMYGVTFAGHPDLRRLLMYDGFEGHPLRKDYPVLRAWPLVEPLPEPQDRPTHIDDLVKARQGDGKFRV